MTAASDPASFERALARLPRWILGLAAAGTALAAFYAGVSWAGGFLLGSLGAWVNLRVIERAVRRLGQTPGGKPGRGTGAWIFVQFTGLVLGAFVILSFSGFSRAATFCGFLVCPAAVVLEIVYELAILNFQK